MTPTEIIAALERCNYSQLIEIRKAADARAKQMKADFKQKGEAMGLIKPRKRNGANEQDAE